MDTLGSGMIIAGFPLFFIAGLKKKGQDGDANQE